MAKDLQSLVGQGSVRQLQEKLENWHQDYENNTSGENMNRCCEILELNSAIQKQLFSILSETSQKDSLNEGAETIKGASGGGAQDSVGEEMQLGELNSTPICRLEELEKTLSSTRQQIKQIEKDLKASQAEECKSLRKLQELNDYEQQIRTLRNEISILDAQKCILRSRLARSPSPQRCKPPCPLSPRTWSPARAKRVNASRRACLIARFGCIFAQERLDAECTLRTFICNMEMVQRIIYIAAVESFRAAKMAFWKIKIQVKETLALNHMGPGSLEAAALDYIVCHTDLYDVFQSVHEVICSMSSNPVISCPAVVDFIVISSLIRELCSVAFLMQTLAPPLDIAFGIDGELFNRTIKVFQEEGMTVPANLLLRRFNLSLDAGALACVGLTQKLRSSGLLKCEMALMECLYYRSFDSDFSAPYVAYHIWPALMENGFVIVKGEVVTKKMCSRRSRIRSRSCSCGRRLAPGQVARSRSLSTVRFKTPGC